MRQLLFNLYNFHEEWAYKAVSAYIKPDIRVTILPFSFAYGEITIANWNSFYGNNGRFYPELIAPFKTFALSETNIELVNYFTVTSRELQQQLMTTDIIFLTGGLPDKTNDRLKELAVIGTLEYFSGLLIGSSAGAIVQLKQYHITPDADYNCFSYQQVLNLITDFAIEVHFEDTVEQYRSIHRVLTETEIPLLYAMEDQGGLIVDNQTVTPLGMVHLYQR